MGGAMNDPTRHLPQKLVSLCTRCHNWVHGSLNRVAAEAAGMIVPRTRDTLLVPVQTVQGRWLFDAAGGQRAA